MKRCITILSLCAIFILKALVGPALAQSQGGLPAEAEQVLFLIDDSSSMTGTAFDPTNPRASRWEVLQKVTPQWLARLGPETLVGALSVGGSCAAPPTINLPVGTERARLAAAIASAQPNGATNLNAALKSAPALFAPGVRGGKRIILISDGVNSCWPHESTCEIARALHQQHGIIIDVVAWVTEPSMLGEFQCVTGTTGGIFTAPRTLSEWGEIPLPVLEPWRYAVLTLGLLTLLLASIILYRHGYHALAWGTSFSTMAAGMFLGLGALLLYLVLFVKAGLIAALLGAAIVAALWALTARRSKQPATSAARPAPWSPLVLTCLMILFAPRVSLADDASSVKCSKLVQGPPRYHHILTLDMSGTVVKQIDEMKALLACYAEMYALPNEEISLVVFGLDEAGSVRELRTFTVPPGGSTMTLNRLLDDLKIQDPQRTKTYFRPLADFLTQFLQKVHLQPVVLVVSDGKSDGFRDAAQGLVSFKEITFESLGKRGIYTAPGMRGWRVAIQGGSGLDLAALFQRPIGALGQRKPASQPLGPAIDPCLIEPELLVETDERIVLRPSWNPFAKVVSGSVALRVKNDCAARFRSFKVELRRAGQTLPVGNVNTLINQELRSFSFPFVQAVNGVGMTEVALQVVLDQGGTTRTIYPTKPPAIALEEISYWSAFGAYWLAAGVGALLLAGGALTTTRRRLARERERPQVVKVLGGHGIPIARHYTVSIGGEGCALVVPGIAHGTVLATAEWAGVRGELTLRPEADYRMKVNGVDVIGSTNYRLGQPLQFIQVQTGTSYDVTLYPGTTRDIGFGNSFAGGGERADFAVGFATFGGVSSSEEKKGFGSVTGTSSGKSTGTDSYI